MKCGICGATTWKPSRGQFEEEILFASDLARHKRQDHPEEFKAARVAKRDKAQAKRQAEEELAQRRRQAIAQASVPVILQEWKYGASYQQKPTGTYKVAPSSKAEGPDWPDYQLYRMPEPGAFAEYEKLEALAQAKLKEAWEGGTPIPPEHFETLSEAAKEA